jgi:hypothetical protein
LQAIPKQDHEVDRLDRLEAKLDLIIRSLGLDGSHTKQQMERKAPSIVLEMQNRLTKRLKRSKNGVCQ